MTACLQEAQKRQEAVVGVGVLGTAKLLCSASDLPLPVPHPSTPLEWLLFPWKQARRHSCLYQ